MTTFWAATFWICLTVLIVCIFVLGAWLVKSADKEEGGNEMPLKKTTRKKTTRKRGTYRRRHDSDTWHFEPTCRWFPKGEKRIWVSSVSRPKHGEMCNNCKRIEDSRP